MYTIGPINYGPTMVPRSTVHRNFVEGEVPSFD